MVIDNITKDEKGNDLIGYKFRPIGKGRTEEIMREVVVLGVGMHPFGRFLDKSLSDLAKVAIWDALKDANVPAKDIQVAYLGNSIGGLITGQRGLGHRRFGSLWFWWYPHGQCGECLRQCLNRF